MDSSTLLNQELKELCVQSGLRLTKQRLEILQAVKGSCEHPDVCSVYAAVKSKVQGISVDTVYRTLQTFENLGLIFRVDNQIPRARFDGDLRSHSHFICVECGEVFDIFGGNEPEIPHGLEGFGEIKRINLQIKGVCKKCKEITKKKGE